MVIVCPLCSSPPFLSLPKVLRHIHISHADDSSFSVQCNLQGCCQTFRNLKTYETHIYTFHNISSMELNSDPPSLNEGEENEVSGWILEAEGMNESDFLDEELDNCSEH